MRDYIVIVGTGSYVIEDEFGEGVVLRSVKQWIDFYGDQQIALFYKTKNKLHDLEKKISYLNFDNIELLHIDYLDDFLSSKNVFASFVCVPDKSHFFYANKMLSSHIPTWMVKPATDNLKEAKELSRLSKNTNIPLWIDYHKRFDKTNSLLKKYVENNTYGNILHYAVQYTQPASLALKTFSWAKDTNVFSYIGCHYVDQIEFLYGQNIKSFKVSSVGTKGTIFTQLNNNCYDTILTTLIVKLQNGYDITCTFQVGWNDPSGTPAKSHQRVEVTFEKGRLIMDQKERGVELWDEKKLTQVNPYFFTKNYDVLSGKYTYSGYGYDSIKYFLDSLKCGKRYASNDLPYIQNVLFSERVLESSKKSLKNNGEWIYSDIKI